MTHGSVLLGALALGATLAGCDDADPETDRAPELVATFQEGLQLPESVLHDAERDVYLVSNINGAPLDKDGNGFISRLSPDGRVLDLKWIEGGRAGAVLHAPKGSAIAGGILYVADIDQVRLFNATTGAAVASVAIPGATFLNDVAADGRGDIHVSDSGLAADPSGFVPTGTDAVWVIGADRTPRALLQSTALRQPNGLAASGDRMLSISFGAPQLVPIDRSGRAGTAATLPGGQLDGIVVVDGELLVSSWEGSAIYRGSPSGPFEPLLGDLAMPADLGYDSDRRRLLVPLVFENRILVYQLP